MHLETKSNKSRQTKRARRIHLFKPRIRRRRAFGTLGGKEQETGMESTTLSKRPQGFVDFAEGLYRCAIGWQRFENPYGKVMCFALRFWPLARYDEQMRLHECATAVRECRQVLE